jgi:hypothetical protein
MQEVWQIARDPSRFPTWDETGLQIEDDVEPGIAAQQRRPGDQ